MSKLLICAATRTETEAARLGIRKAGLEDRFDILKTGIGPINAAMVLREYLDGLPGDEKKPIRIISTGFAGSWSIQLGVGSWIVAAKVTNELGDELKSCGEIWKAPAVALPSAVVSVNEIMEIPPPALFDKLTAHYGAEVPIAVDMESFALAGVAFIHQVPFTILRYVTDSPEHPLPAFVRQLTSVASETDPRKKIHALFKGTRSLVSQPGKVANLLRNGSGWRGDLLDGWERFAGELIIPGTE